MLVVKIELWPGGWEARKRTLATGYIVNDNTGTLKSGNYQIVLHDKAGKKWKTGEVKGFARQRWLAWDLLFLSLRNILESRHGKRNGSSGQDHSGTEAAGCGCGREHGGTGHA